jgi:isocitrate dehydrogenase
MNQQEGQPNVPKTVVLVPGDGIGPEISEAVKGILLKAGANVNFVEGSLGENTPAEEVTRTLELMRQHGVMLKGPTGTPTALAGTKSFNVTVRKGFEQNVCFRRCVSMDPVVPNKHPKMDILFVRENMENLYAAIEHRQTPTVAQSLNLMSEEGCEKVIRAAFEAAVEQGRKNVAGMEKPNILKDTGGMFERKFRAIAKEYEKFGITSQFYNIDDGLAEVAANPEKFDVIVTTNMFGDIGSDITAKLAGSVGLVGSSNVGQRSAMFEAIHGTAPDIIGQDKANPSGLLSAAIDMLVYIGGEKNIAVAQKIQEAWLWTLQDGYHTGDMARGGKSEFVKAKEAETGKSLLVGTKAFSTAVEDRLARIEKGDHMPDGALKGKLIDFAKYAGALKPGSADWIEKVVRNRPPRPTKPKSETVDGVDVFVEYNGLQGIVPAEFARTQHINLSELFKIKEFANVQEVRSYGAWLGKALEAVLKAEPSLAAQGTNQSLGSLLSQWGIDGKELSKTLLDKPAAEALKDIQRFNGASRELVKISFNEMAQKMHMLAEAYNLELERVTNRGLEVWPTILDPDVVDHQRCRFKFSQDIAGKRRDRGSMASNFVHAMHKLEEYGIKVVHTELLRSFEIEGEAKPVKSYSTAYGADMGERYGTPAR